MLAPLATVTAAGVIDGRTIALTDGGRVRLASIQAPIRPLDRLSEPDWPAEPAARDALATLVTAGPLRLYRDGPTINRYGDRLAHAISVEGVWLQRALLAAGHALVATRADQRALARPMLAAETTARAGGRGLWQMAYYAPILPRQAGRALGGFRLVEGRVLDVATVRGTTYLNFGPNWRTDFTVAIRGRHRRRFTAADIAPARWKGRIIRVRGRLIARNGPMIEATHPEQIEPFA